MEFMGFKDAMLFLLTQEIPVSVFISDRHTAIASHMKKELGNITHYFDLWHIAKSKITFPWAVAVCSIVDCLSIMVKVSL